MTVETRSHLITTYHVLPSTITPFEHVQTDLS